jgi:predicted SprT family Zn-dependent metalloprotease
MLSNNNNNHNQDYLIALQIQFDLEENDFEEEKSHKNNDLAKSGKIESPDKHLLNPELEFIDPNPDIRALFQDYDKKYFYNRLGSCIVEWSKRMTICAGIFYLREGGIIRLSEPLLKFRPRIDMVQTLLHEMIHAYLYLTRNFKDRGEHGDEFKSHMNRINDLAGTNITVYHTFHDEVNFQRQHVWRCTGVCRTMKPYLGFVKRSMNRAPGPHDIWWADHSRKCSGKFEKTAEPEGFKAKATKRKSDDSVIEPSQARQKATTKKIFLSDGSSQMNGKASGKKVNSSDNSLVKLDKFFPISQVETRKLSSQTQNVAGALPSKTDDDDILVINEVKSEYNNEIMVLNSSKFAGMNSVECPLCFIKLPNGQIDSHVNNHFD